MNVPRGCPWIFAIALCAACGGDAKVQVDARITGCTGVEARLVVFDGEGACADEDPRANSGGEHEAVATTPWVDPSAAGPVTLEVPADGPVAVVAECRDARGVVTEWGCGVQQGKTVHVAVAPVCSSRCAARAGCPDGSEDWEGGGGAVCLARCGVCAPEPDGGATDDGGTVGDAGDGDAGGDDAGPDAGSCTPLAPHALASIGGKAQGLVRLGGGRLVVAAGGANGVESLVGALPDLARTDPPNQDLSEAFAVAAFGDQVYVAAGSVAESEHNLEVLAVGGDGVLAAPAGLLVPGELRDVAVAGDVLVAAAGSEGLTTFTLGQPATPDDQGRADFGGDAVAVAVVGATAIVGVEGEGVHVVDIDPVTSPTAVSQYAAASGAIGVALSAAADRAVVARGDDGIDVLTLAGNALGPLGHIEVGGAVRARIFDGRGFVAVQQGGVVVVDLATGTERATIPAPENDQQEPVSVEDVLVEGTWAVLAGGWDGLYVVDVSCALR